MYRQGMNRKEYLQYRRELDKQVKKLPAHRRISFWRRHTDWNAYGMHHVLGIPVDAVAEKQYVSTSRVYQRLKRVREAIQ